MPIAPPSPKLSWICDARYCRVTNASLIPWRWRRSKMCPRHGLLTIETIGLGRLIVRGRRRLPSPPAMTTACIRASLEREGTTSRRTRRSFPRRRYSARSLRRVGELVGERLGEVDRLSLDVVVVGLEHLKHEVRRTGGHLPVGAEHRHAPGQRGEVQILVTRVVVDR